MVLQMPHKVMSSCIGDVPTRARAPGSMEIIQASHVLGSELGQEALQGKFYF